jgi:transposase-like protein
MGRTGSKYRKFTEAYRELAVRRLLETDNVSERCRELGISRQLLYQWRDKRERERQKQDPAQARVEQLRRENAQLKRVLGEKTLQLDFLRGALQKVEALRQERTGSGETASTGKSGR